MLTIDVISFEQLGPVFLQNYYIFISIDGKSVFSSKVETQYIWHQRTLTIYKVCLHFGWKDKSRLNWWEKCCNYVAANIGDSIYRLLQIFLDCEASKETEMLASYVMRTTFKLSFSKKVVIELIKESRLAIYSKICRLLLIWHKNNTVI